MKKLHLEFREQTAFYGIADGRTNVIKKTARLMNGSLKKSENHS